GPEDADLDAFSEISEMALLCQFRDCEHHKEPGCRVRQAVAAGEIAADRLASFHALKSELAGIERERPARKKADANRPKRSFGAGKAHRKSRGHWDES